MKSKDIKYIFEQNPELSDIGTKTQYFKYLKTIFPESKVQDILWHGAKEKFEEFDSKKMGTLSRNFGKGVYATPDFSWARKYAQVKGGKEPLPLLADVKNPLITDSKFNEFHKVFSYIEGGETILDYLDKDSVANFEYLDRDSLNKINEYFTEYVGEKDEKGLPVYQKNIYSMPSLKEVVLPSVEQTHILGSKKDAEGFKKFVQNNSSEKSLEKRILTSIFSVFTLTGLIFSTNQITGNVIGVLNSKFNFIWPALTIAGIVGLFITRKYKK